MKRMKPTSKTQKQKICPKMAPIQDKEEFEAWTWISAVSNANSSPKYALLVNVQPNASLNQINFDSEGCNIKISSPPTKGKANKDLLQFIAKTLNISKSQVTLIKGQTSHKKIFVVEISPDHLRERLTKIKLTL